MGANDIARVFIHPTESGTTENSDEQNIFLDTSRHPPSIRQGCVIKSALPKSFRPFLRALNSQAPVSAVTAQAWTCLSILQRTSSNAPPPDRILQQTSKALQHLHRQPRLPSPTLAYPCIANPFPTFQMLDPWILRRTAFKHCLEQGTRYFRQDPKEQIFP